MDNTVFSVVADRGGSTTWPGLNASTDTIRLYFHSSGNGNKITFNILGDRKIVSIDFNFGATASNAQIILGSQTYDYLSNQLSSQSIVHTGLDIISFSIQNTNLTNVQLHINSIVITYETP